MVVEAYRLDRYDNEQLLFREAVKVVVEAYRLDRYDNPTPFRSLLVSFGCRSLSFG